MSQEILKNIPDFDGYFISNMGRIRMKNGKFSNAKPRCDGYTLVVITRNDGKKVGKYIHILVAEAFIENKEDKPYVNHIDGKRSNNKVENLEWVTPSENNIKRTVESKIKSKRVIQYNYKTKKVIRVWDSAEEISISFDLKSSSVRSAISKEKKLRGFRWRYEENIKIVGEIWEPLMLDGDITEVSSCGRVKLPSGKVTYGNLGSSYYRVTIRGKEYRVNRLVALAFKPVENPEKYVVDHIDSDKKNNNVDNLEWVTNRVNVQRAKDKSTKECRKVNQYNLNNELIKTHPSMAAAGREVGLDRNTMRSICLGMTEPKFIHDEHIWKVDD